MLRASLILITLLVTINSASRASDQKTPEQYWKETGLNFQAVANQLNDRCYKSAKSYLACIQGLNVVAEAMTPVSVFATSYEVEENPEFFGEMVQNFSNYNLYRYKKLDAATTPMKQWERISAFKKAQREGAARAYKAFFKLKLNFQDVLMSLKPQVITGELKDSEALLASEIFNTILASAVDPHTHIEPMAEMEDDFKSTDSSYAGVGITLEEAQGAITVRGVARGGPSLEAGLKTNDVIQSIEDQKVTTLQDVSNKLKGPEGTTVRFGVIRKGSILHFVVTRRKLASLMSKSELLKTQANRMATLSFQIFLKKKPAKKSQTLLWNLVFTEQMV